MARPSRTGTRGLHRDKHGAYRIDLRWRDPATGQPRRYGERLPDGITAAAAKLRARHLLNAALAGEFTGKRDAPRRLHETLDEFERWTETNRPKSLRGNKSLVRVLKANMSDVRLDELSPLAVERFKKIRREQGASPATINRGVAMLKRVCGLAAKWGHMSSERALAIRGVPLMTEPPGRVRYLSDEEQKALLAALSPPGIRVIVLVAILSGMRRANVVLLQKSAVDLRNRQITLVKTKANRVQVIPISETLAAVLAEAMKTSSNEYVFNSGRGKPYSTNAVTRAFHRAVLKAGIQNLRLHDARHDYATKLRRRGVGLDVIQQLLGHADITTTRRYAHVEHKLMRDAVATQDEVAVQDTDGEVVRIDQREHGG